MLMVIDIGNTNTVFATYADETISGSWRCRTESTRTADEYGTFLIQTLSTLDLSLNDMHHIYVSSVVPEANQHIERFCKKYTRCTPFFIASGNIKLPIHIDQPSEAGADRLANALAVLSYYTAPAIVVDFGTATTFDVISAEGAYIGGVIAPGVKLSAEALSRRAAKLPQIRVQKPATAIGKNTIHAMESGMYWGYIGLVEGILSRIKAELPGKPFVIATGGLASLYAQSTTMIDIVDEDLLLKGIYTVYKQQNANA